MKHFLTIIAFLCSILTAYSQSPNIHIAVDFPKYKDAPVSYSYALFSNEQKVFQSEELTMENGQFQIEAEINVPHTLTVLMKEEEIILFSNGSSGGILIFPDDNLYLSISDFGFDHITFAGKGSTRFAFEKTYKTIIKDRLPYESIRDAIEKIRRADLEAAIVDELIADYSEQLSEHEKQVILVNKYLDIYGLPVYNISKRKYDAKDVQFITDHVINNNRIKHLIELSNKERLNLNLSYRYHNLLKEYAYIKQTLLDKQKFVPHKSIKDDYFTLNTIYKDSENRKYVLGNFVVRSAYSKTLEDGLNECFSHYFSNFASDDPLYKKVELAYNRLNNNLTKGSIPPNFMLTDSIGNNVQIRDYLGKVVVLDFWYYGCGGCAQITPALVDIKKQIGKRDDLIFVSVSIDKYRQSWLRGIGKFTPKESEQLYTGGNGSKHPIIEHFNILSYPTLIIIDKNGKVFKGRASRPDSEKDKLISEINMALNN